LLRVKLGSARASLKMSSERASSEVPTVVARGPQLRRSGKGYAVYLIDTTDKRSRRSISWARFKTQPPLKWRAYLPALERQHKQLEEEKLQVQPWRQSAMQHSPMAQPSPRSVAGAPFVNAPHSSLVAPQPAPWCQWRPTAAASLVERDVWDQLTIPSRRLSHPRALHADKEATRAERPWRSQCQTTCDSELRRESPLPRTYTHVSPDPHPECLSGAHAFICLPPPPPHSDPHKRHIASFLPSPARIHELPHHTCTHSLPLCLGSAHTRALFPFTPSRYPLPPSPSLQS
jgi:hypothetical protein